MGRRFSDKDLPFLAVIQTNNEMTRPLFNHLTVRIASPWGRSWDGTPHPAQPHSPSLPPHAPRDGSRHRTSSAPTASATRKQVSMGPWDPIAPPRKDTRMTISTPALAPQRMRT